jgi:hypothetical protein
MKPIDEFTTMNIKLVLHFQITGVVTVFSLDVQNTVGSPEDSTVAEMAIRPLSFFYTFFLS